MSSRSLYLLLSYYLSTALVLSMQKPDHAPNDYMQRLECESRGVIYVGHVAAACRLFLEIESRIRC